MTRVAAPAGSGRAPRARETREASALLEVTIGATATSRLFPYPLPPDLPVDQVAVALVDPQATDEPEETRWDLRPMARRPPGSRGRCAKTVLCSRMCLDNA